MRKSLAALLPLTFTLGLAACASAPFSPSPHYATVSKHLDIGGQVLVYADVEGDLAAGADYLDKLLARVRKSVPDEKLDRVNARRILQQLGLDEVLAVGLSSSRDGKVFHNRAFFEYGKKRRGLLLMTSAAPHPLEVPDHAPADADIAFESDLKLKSLLDLVETIARDVGGKDADELFAGLDKKLPGTALSVRQVLGHLDTRLVGVVRIDEKRAFVWPGDDKVKLPGFDILLGVDALDVLFDAYLPMLRILPNIKTGDEGELTWVEIEAAVPGAEWLKPVLVKNRTSGRVFLATNLAFLKEYLANKHDDHVLGKTADWRRATGRFAAKANGISYLSGAFLPKVARVLRPLGKDDKGVQVGLDLMLDLLPEAGIPFAAQQVNLSDGLYYASYTTTSHKSTLFSALLTGPVVVAGAAAAMATSGLRKFLDAGKAKPSVEREPLDDGEEEEKAPGLLGALKQDRFKIPLGGRWIGKRSAIFPSPNGIHKQMSEKTHYAN